MEKKVWVITDNRMGSNGQARGVLQLLGWDSEEKQVVYNCLSKIPNFLKGSSLLGITKESRKAIQSNFPDLVITASRRTAPVARWIKKQSQGKTKIVQLMHPGMAGIADFDRVFVSDHDKHKKSSENIIYVTGCAHRITEKSLAQAQEKWCSQFAHLPRPFTAVIVGGSIKSHIFSVENAQEFGRQVKAYKDKVGGSILITTSKRTGLDAQNAIVNEIKNIPSHTYLWGVDEGENPFMGYIACADDIIVTGDSVSMCSESCGSGKRVMIFRGKDWLTTKHQRFVSSFFDKGLAFPLEQEPKDTDSYSCYNAAEIIAEEIKKLFK